VQVLKHLNLNIVIMQDDITRLHIADIVVVVVPSIKK